MKVTQNDLDRIPNVHNGIDGFLIKLNSEINQRLDVINLLQKNYGESLHYGHNLIEIVNNEIRSLKKGLPALEKQLKCRHKVEDLSWEYEGHDSHKEYYILVCKNCGVVINEYSE